MISLVVAFKYNDILYATSTEEFFLSQRKKLLIICSPDKKVEDFPLRYLFDEVHYILYKQGIFNFLMNLFKVKLIRKSLESDFVILSNPILLINKLIFKLSRAHRVVWVEDGLMNYYPMENIHFSVARWKKKLVQSLLFIPNIEEKATSFVSYLLAPNQAKSFWGERKKIEISSEVLRTLNLESFSFLSGKKIFVGQPLYKDNLINIENYRSKVNRVIKENSIDYYLPHFWASKKENISCEYFTLDGKGVTLEIISSKYNFEIYSISSTVLYSTKLINPLSKSYLVDINGLGAKQEIIRSIVDDVITID